MISLTVLALLALAAYRLTRLLVIDSIIEDVRNKVLVWLGNRGYLVTNKLYDLLTCTWCVGIWLSALVYYLYSRDFQISVEALLNISAIAGVQGLIHALEPAE